MTQVELPPPWVFDNDGQNPDLDEVLGVAQEPLVAGLDYEEVPGLREPRSERAFAQMSHVWRAIYNTETGERGVLRIQRSYGSRGAHVSGVVLLPARDGDRLTGVTLRSLPLAAIEAAVNEDRFELSSLLDLRLAVEGQPSGFKYGDPVRTRPRVDRQFYEKLALWFIYLKRRGDRNPTATIAKESSVPIRTAQNWVTEARKRGYLPPGIKGRAG